MPYDFDHPTKQIIELRYDYKPPCSDGREVFGEDWNSAVPGQKDVVAIHEHPARGEGDKWFYDIEYIDSSITRIFNPHLVVYK